MNRVVCLLLLTPGLLLAHNNCKDDDDEGIEHKTHHRHGSHSEKTSSVHLADKLEQTIEPPQVQKLITLNDAPPSKVVQCPTECVRGWYNPYRICRRDSTCPANHKCCADNCKRNFSYCVPIKYLMVETSTQKPPPTEASTETSTSAVTEVTTVSSEPEVTTVEVIETTTADTSVAEMPDESSSIFTPIVVVGSIVSGLAAAFYWFL